MGLSLIVPLTSPSLSSTGMLPIISENTLASFEAAIREGACGIESDIHRACTPLSASVLLCRSQC